MIGQKQFSVLNAEIKSSAAPQLLAVKAFATFLSSGNAAESLKLLGEHFYKVECVFPMVIVYMLPHAEFERNDHRDDALHFMKNGVLSDISDSQLQAVAPENWVSPVMCAAIHLHEKNFEGALRTLQLTDHLESMAMQVQIYCQMERPELGNN